MPPEAQPDLFAAGPGGDAGNIPAPGWQLVVTFDLALGGFRFDWTGPLASDGVAQGILRPCKLGGIAWYALDWEFVINGVQETDVCHRAPVSIRALMKRIQKRMPVAAGALQMGILPDVDFGPLAGGRFLALELPVVADPVKCLTGPVEEFIKLLEPDVDTEPGEPQARGRAAMATLIKRRLGLKDSEVPPDASAPKGAHFLQVTLEMLEGCIRFAWTEAATQTPVATGRVTCSGRDELTWELNRAGAPPEVEYSTHHASSIRAALQRWRLRFPLAAGGFSGVRRELSGRRGKPISTPEPPFRPNESPWAWLEANLKQMAFQLASQFSPLEKIMAGMDPLLAAELLRDERRFQRREERRAEAEQRQREAMERLVAQRRLRKATGPDAAKGAIPKPASASASAAPAPPPARPPLPPVPVRLELPALAFQDTAFPLPDLRGYFLRERAACWWVSNQSDDLLALPHCRIQRLDYQVRTALRVLGPLRGRALLSDEVGLGKTIEAGLVLKELLTRGMVKRFLVLTVPSLVDQWEEELNDKFNLPVVTTNHAAARADLGAFWRDNPAIVASLHTLKQPAQLEVARAVNWDLLIVDEAHYLRNRESQAWQAVNALPRQFLLLLTATPVQNSLEDLYNLITLLQPGQLPTPREFRARFVDPKRPRQPREPEELRRLLGQVMIRNTRANAGLNLPPRRAETVLFEPAEEERTFWQSWEAELRTELAALPASQSSLWGRLLLQAAGSSPAAWLEALEKFPNQTAARAWQTRAPLEASWRRKCELLPPLTRGEGGVVIFTQFLRTQAALAESLRAARVEAFVINGSTPAARRQPLTEEFRQRGGALLLTHSGTEGRNLQFCHRLVNFDLPWNPMEIEQRIGRLHRLGQQHPVRIYNLVQAGTLQEHLLQILQEKLNLFELVVGETGLILGERFASDEFAEEVLRRWRDSGGRVAEALQSLGDDLAAARDGYQEVRQLDATLFAKDYESL